MPRSVLISPSKRLPNLKNQTRISLPKAPERPLRIRESILKREVYDPDVWWFTLHTRGLRRSLVGLDPLEQRAVPDTQVRGTLPERIVYKWLVVRMGMRDGIEFTFQTSLQGGRLELGGIVADFVFPYERFVIQVQGPTHSGYRRRAKDEEQKLILAEMGFEVYDIWIDVIQNEYRFEEEMRRIFALRGVGGGDESIPDQSADSLDSVYNMVMNLFNEVEALQGAIGG